MKKTDNLKFPVIKEDPLPPSIRSVDEIYKWIKTIYPFVFNREIYEKEKRKNSVNVKFVLHE